MTDILDDELEGRKDLVPPKERPTLPPKAEESAELSDRDYMRKGFEQLQSQIKAVADDVKILVAAAPGEALHDINNKLMSFAELTDTVRSFLNEAMRISEQNRQTTAENKRIAARLVLAGIEE